ncbi:hypothetical protein KDA14_05245 [Candidatus Saccharibacteria bacterium]|nr:hypothetical protein [Candidatus Saccharibacteria bacterium]
MKRFRILTKPTNVAEVAEGEILASQDTWLLEAETERRFMKRQRKFRHKLSTN